jgi:hypothetical protein
MPCQESLDAARPAIWESTDSVVSEPPRADRSAAVGELAAWLSAVWIAEDPEVVVADGDAVDAAELEPAAVEPVDPVAAADVLPSLDAAAVVCAALAWAE